MAQTIQTIGIANGGGDCPGLNAVIRGAVRGAILGTAGGMVCLHARIIESVALDEAVGETRLVDPKGSMVRTARAAGITFGDQ